MKRIILYLTIVCSVIACKNDQDPVSFYAHVRDVSSSMTLKEAELSFAVESSGSIEGITAEYDAEQHFSLSEAMNLKDDRWSVTLNGLKANTKYFVRFRLHSPYNSMLVDTVCMFTTADYQLAGVGALTVKDTTDTSVGCSFPITSTGGLDITEAGVCFSTQSQPTVESGKQKAVKNGNTYACSLSGLTPNTLYYLRAYAVNAKGVTYSNEVRVLTYALPQVVTGEASQITTRTAHLEGELLFTGNAATTVGICYSASGNLTYNSANAIPATFGSDGRFAIDLSGLYSDCTYSYRAYAVNKIGVVYGETKTFQTLPPTLPTVVTGKVTALTNTGATIEGNVTDDGGLDVTERGICYSTSSTPTVSDNRAKASQGGTGEFSCTLSSLTEKTTYYARAYALSSKGVVYGDQVQFKTAGTPTLTISNAVLWRDEMRDDYYNKSYLYEVNFTYTLTADVPIIIYKEKLSLGSETQTGNYPNGYNVGSSTYTGKGRIKFEDTYYYSGLSVSVYLETNLGTSYVSYYCTVQ